MRAPGTSTTPPTGAARPTIVAWSCADRRGSAGVCTRHCRNEHACRHRHVLDDVVRVLRARAQPPGSQGHYDPGDQDRRSARRARAHAAQMRRAIHGAADLHPRPPRRGLRRAGSARAQRRARRDAGACRLRTTVAATAIQRVVAVMAGELSSFEFGIAAAVFGVAPTPNMPWYDFRVVAEEPTNVVASGGVRANVHGGLEELPSAHVVIVPGWADPTQRPSPQLADALRQAH